MAIAQRQFPSTWSRPSARPLPQPEARPRVRARRRVSQRALYTRMLLAAALAVSLIAYISGYALMTGANYQRVRLVSQMRAIQTQRQRLTAELNTRRARDVVEAWARASGMIPAETMPVILHGSMQEGQ